jgi:hypothetical protein
MGNRQKAIQSTEKARRNGSLMCNMKFVSEIIKLSGAEFAAYWALY